MKKSSLLFLFSAILNLHVVYSQSLPTTREQYSFIKWYIKYKKLISLADTLVLHSTNVFGRSDINEISNYVHLSNTDKKYINKQVGSRSKTITIDSVDLKKLGWNNHDQVAGEFINSLSLPIFSIDRKLVIIEWGIYCGNDCGEAGLDVFIKDRYGKWKPSKAPTPIIMF